MHVMGFYGRAHRFWGIKTVSLTQLCDIFVPRRESEEFFDECKHATDEKGESDFPKTTTKLIGGEFRAKFDVRTQRKFLFDL